jgi:hypothetical protein
VAKRSKYDRSRSSTGVRNEWPHSPEAVGNWPATPALSQGSPDLTDVLQRLRRLEADANGFWAWIKKWGGFVGLIAGLIGIPKGIFDGAAAAWPHPKTSILLRYPLQVSFAPDTQEFAIAFDFSIRNEGTKDDRALISSSSAELTPPPETYPPLRFRPEEIAITEVDTQKPFQYVDINKGSSRYLHCKLTAHLKDIPTKEGRWALTLRLGGDSGHIEGGFLFYLQPEFMSALLKGGSLPIKSGNVIAQGGG